MTHRSLALVCVVATLAISLVATTQANAQDAEAPQEPGLQSGPLLSAHVTATAAAVVNGTVTSVEYVELDGVPFTVAGFEITSRLSGDIDGTVFIATKGGMLADGRIIRVSHNPTFELGDVAQVALAPVPASQLAVAHAAIGVPADRAFVAVDGEHGVAHHSLSSASFAGVRDFVIDSTPWQSFNPPATFKVDLSGAPTSTNATINAARRAADQWENDSASSIDFHYAGTTNAGGVNLSDGVNTISFSYQPTSGALAEAFWHPQADGQIAFDIRLNTRYTFRDRTGGATLWYDLETVILHELGHVLGLGHVGTVNDGINYAEVMDIHVPGRTTKRLAAGDLAAVNQLYPAATCDGQQATVNLMTGQGAPTPGSDVIFGTNGPDTINGLGGDDIICGRGGNDTISGGAGNDRIFGGDGADRIYGNTGRDVLNGQSGNDRLFGGVSGDRLYGLDGQDYLSGGGGWDTLNGHSGNDVIYGGGGADKIDGGAGIDVITAGHGADSVVGGSGDDRLFGGVGSDKMWGGSGADTLRGGTGADKLYGQADDDELFGDGGWDQLHGGGAVDTCEGGSGQDTALSCETVNSAP